MKLLKQATYIRYVSAKLSKFIQISAQTLSDFFYKKFFENQKGPGTSYNIIISRTKRAFEVKSKTFFFVSKVLSFRHAKQTSKNVADTTFNP